jgi:hypothetical protein
MELTKAVSTAFSSLNSIAMIPLPDDDLEALCSFLSTASYIYYPVATDYFSDLYSTGCRPKELLAPNRWTYNSPTDIELIPLKGNATRYFTASDLSSSLLFAIINQVLPYNGLTYRQLKAVLQHIIPVLLPQTADKSAIDYIFRYNKVKQLKAAGKTDAEVQAIFGWINTAFVTLYNTQSLFINSPLPPEIFNTIIDDSANYLTDSDGTLITYP